MSRISQNIQQDDATLDARIFFRTPDQDPHEIDQLIVLGINPKLWTELKDQTLAQLLELSGHEVYGDISSFSMNVTVRIDPAISRDPNMFMELLDNAVQIMAQCSQK